MDRVRPQLLVGQRDSDAQREVDLSRTQALASVAGEFSGDSKGSEVPTSAFSSLAELQIQTSSSLLSQFHSSYIPRVFNLSLPWCVGGPDFHGCKRWRRTDDAPRLSLDKYTQMMAERVEANIRWDWDLNPSLWSLSFASKVNLGVSMSIKRCLRRAGEAENTSEQEIGEATANIYRLLQDGEYEDGTGKRCKVRGDVSKINQIIGLTANQRSLLRNYQFMSSRLPGTRQIRRSINHCLFSARVVYGLPVFITVTPSEKHSGLSVRLFRYRRNDPGIAHAGEAFKQYIGANTPSIYFGNSNEWEDESVDLPEYDVRRDMVGRDPLCALHAFWINIRVILPALYGYRMCPKCPNCVEGETPCMDIFGSNATPMGGSIGRCDAAIGAVEAQKAEGVLHLHAFLFPQTTHQFRTLHEISGMLRDSLITVDMLKAYINNARRASYPDVEKFRKERDSIEAEWPAYRKEKALSKPPCNCVPSSKCSLENPHPLNSEAWLAEGREWKKSFDARLQYVMSHMNHHIHPVVNLHTGERRPLKSCCKKGAPKLCKGGFPLESEITDDPILVCACVAEVKNLCQSGPRSLIGTILPARNDPWLNAGPSAWMYFTGDNGDIKFPHRLPIMPETHEKVKLFNVRWQQCCQQTSALQMTYDMQAAQAVAAGYFGGYSAKMQDIGTKELARLREAMDRRNSSNKELNAPKAFQEYSRRLVRDLEAKGIIRTAVESLNLSTHAATSDCLGAECMRTFATVTFPASLLLKREEVETLKIEGRSIIAAVHSGKTDARKSWLEPPFDLMYGFRGAQHVVDLLSPFEMLRYWRMEKVLPPKHDEKDPKSIWTPEGEQYKKILVTERSKNMEGWHALHCARKSR